MGICLCPNSYNIVRKNFIKNLQIYSQKLSEAVVPIENDSVLSTAQKEADENMNSNIQIVDNKNNSLQTIDPLERYDGKSESINKKNYLEKVDNNLNKSKTFMSKNTLNINDDIPEKKGYQINTIHIITKPENTNDNIKVNSLFINYRLVNKFKGDLETVFEVRSEMSNSKLGSKEPSKNGNSKFSKKFDN